MKSLPPRPFRGLLALPFLFSTSFAGPNANAVLSVDLAAASSSVDSVLTLSADSNSFWVSVRVSGAVGLDGFGCELAFDSARLNFIQAVPYSIADALPNFLTGQGGQSAGFIGRFVRGDSTRISLADALIGSDSARSSGGEGILALIRFRTKGMPGEARFSLGAIQLLDWRQQVDTGVTATGALLTLVSGPVTAWSRRTPAPQYRHEFLTFQIRDVLGRRKIPAWR